MSKLPNNRSSLSSPSKPVFRPSPIDPRQTNPNRNDSTNHPLRIGDRVSSNEKSGTVAYIGPTQFAEGEWIGIILDEIQGKNDGSYNSVRYFQTDTNRGLFCRPDKVQRLSTNGNHPQTSIYNSARSSPLGATNNINRNAPTTTSLDPSNPKDLQIGDRVAIRGTKYGTLKYIGRLHVDDGIWCGIKLDGPWGKHDGKVNGVRYFTVSHRFGVFAPLRRVEKVPADAKDPQSRASIISTDSSNQFHDSASHSSHLSEFSASSTESDPFAPRSPSKTQQRSSSSDMQNTLSAEIFTLRETIFDREQSIKTFEQQKETDRLELSHATRQLAELQSYLVVLGEQKQIQENENTRLNKEHLQLTQRVDDLQYQLDEYRFVETNREHLAKQDELAAYEKVAELESMNLRLTKEKHTFEEQLREKETQTSRSIDQLRKQIELLRGQVSELEIKELSQISQLTEQEASHQRQLREYQTKLDQISKEEQNVRLRLTSLEQETEKRVTDLSNELKRQRESIVPDLQRQCQTLQSELENRDRTATMALSERETYYQQQIEEYRANIHQSARETERVCSELRQRNEDNERKDKQAEALIQELRESYKQIQTKLTSQEQQLNQRESFYEQQIQEYENNLDRAARETENIQTELVKLDEEKASHDQTSNTTIRSLRDDHEQQYKTLQNQLNEMRDQDRTQNVILSERIGRYEIEMKESQIKHDQDYREVTDLRNELIRLQEEKTSNEKQFHQTINTLRDDLERLQRESNEREHQANITLVERDLQYKQQHNENNNVAQRMETELRNLQKEKTDNEEQLNETISKLRQDLEVIQTEAQNRDRTEIESYQNKSDESLRQLENLQTEVLRLEDEKTSNDKQFNETLDTLKEEHERQLKELQTELDELNERELKANKTLHHRESEFDEQLTEYRQKLEEATLRSDDLQSEITRLEYEKSEYNETVSKLEQDLQALKTEQETRGDTETVAHGERDEIIQALSNLRLELTRSEEDKTTLNETIDTLRGEHERQLKELQMELDELNERELKANKTLHHRESEFDDQLTEYRQKLEEATLRSDDLQSELSRLEYEKSEHNDIVSKLEQDLQTLKTEQENRDDTETIQTLTNLRSEVTRSEEDKTTLNETIDTLKQDLEKLREEFTEREREKVKNLHEQKSHYEQEIDEYQKNLELSIRQTNDVQTEFVTLQEEKDLNDQRWNERISSLEQDLQTQIDQVTNEYRELQERYDTQSEELLRQEHRLNDVDQLDVQIEELYEQNRSQIKQIDELQLELDEARDTREQNEIFQCAENLSTINQALKKEIEDLKEDNQRLQKVDHDQWTEKQSEIDRLNRQLNDFQQMNLDLVEKQAHIEEQYIASQKAQEQQLKEKIAETEMKMALMKSEYMVEMENTKLDHDQAILRLKAQYQQTPPGKGKK